VTVVALSARAAAARLAGRVRRHPVALAVTGGVIALQAVYQAGMALCPRMTMTACLAAAILVVLGASVIAMAARAAWLGAAAARAVAALPSAAPPEALAGAARRAGIRRIRCLAGSGATAFCAGLLAPRVYITAAAVTTLGPGALDAVLVHEAAHARRRDPLRRLAARAASDALFYLPLARGQRCGQPGLTAAGRGQVAAGSPAWRPPRRLITCAAVGASAASGWPGRWPGRQAEAYGLHAGRAAAGAQPVPV